MRKGRYRDPVTEAANHITLGELGRRADRLDQEMRLGFDSLRNEIQRLNFIPSGVYAADRSADQERIRRLEQDLSTEVKERESALAESNQRAWQARLSFILALIGLPVSIIGSLIVALVLTQMK